MTDQTSTTTLTDKAYKTQLNKLNELQDLVGKEVGLTEWVTMEQDRIDSFATTTEDNQWIHINPEMSKQFSPYGAPIAHGFLVLSLAPKFSYETLSIGDVVMGVNYGCDKVRFPNATKVGARLRGRIKVADYQVIAGGARYKLEITFELEGEEKPACVAIMVAQAYTGDEKKAAQVKQLNAMADAQAAQKSTTDAAGDGDDVLYEVSDHVAIITLNRPDSYNGINKNLLQGLYKKFKQARDDKSVKAIVLAGNGRGFCGGADMKDFSGQGTGADVTDFLISTYRPTLQMMLETNKPTIAAIHGAAAGAGTGFALACDFRVMDAKSSFAFIFSNIGLVADNGANWLLQRNVGYSKALQYCMEGKKIPASECLEVGLANKLVDEGKALEAAKDWATLLSKKAPLAFGAQKQILRYAYDHNLMETFAEEARHQGVLIESKDHKEGIMAFMEKRKPNFKGA